MISLSPTLLAAQKTASSAPYVKLEAANAIAGVTRLNFSRLYSGNEPDYYHALTMPDDGALIRVRITPPTDSRKLYYQRVPGPGLGSEFSQWIYSSQYNAVIVAAASLGAEVSIFWIKSDRKIERIMSTDYGATWGSAELIDYTPTTAINGISAAYKPDGDLALFFADQQTLYVKKRISGQWQAEAAWDKTSGELSGVAAVYDGDWNLFITGKDSGNNFKLWSLVYGDGNAIPVDTWSELTEIATAPAVGSSFEYRHAFLDRPDVFRSFYVEKFSGQESYSRPFRTQTVAETAFIDCLWREAVPFNLSSEYGLAVSHHGAYCWLSAPNGVWRAPLSSQNLDLSADVISLKQENRPQAGKLSVELRNDDGCYNTLPPPLGIGCELRLSPGYGTSQGNEASPGQSFYLHSYEHLSSGGQASLVMHAADSWHLLNAWQARQQFRWNSSLNQKHVRDILAFVLARAGLKLEVISSSATITSFYPDFSISPGNRGSNIVAKLLDMVPDVLFIEGYKAYLLNPQASDSACYAYGSDHPIVEGRYRQMEAQPNRIQVEGRDPASGNPILAEGFDWESLELIHDRLLRIEDSNITSADQAHARGEAILNQARISSANGFIRIPPNCGQQFYDVIEIDDKRAGLAAARRRVLGLSLLYYPRRGEFQQKLFLGAV